MKLTFKKAWMMMLFLVLGNMATANASAAVKPDQPGWNVPTKEDDQQLRLILDNYVKAFTEGDKALFESQLLDLSVPFSYVSDNNKKADLQSYQKYVDFRKSVFESGAKLKQRFSNIKIEQLGGLAQVSLDYESAARDRDFDGKGWKVIQLIKVNQQWKIASEFYTGYPDK